MGFLFFFDHRTDFNATEKKSCRLKYLRQNLSVVMDFLCTTTTTTVEIQPLQVCFETHTAAVRGDRFRSHGSRFQVIVNLE
jgi:hypothetical protein